MGGAVHRSFSIFYPPALQGHLYSLFPPLAHFFLSSKCSKAHWDQQVCHWEVRQRGRVFYIFYFKMLCAARKSKQGGEHITHPDFFFEIKLIEWHWWIKLNRSQVYHSILHHLYICIVCVHTQSQISFHYHTLYLLYPFIPLPHPPFPLVITILLSVPMNFVCLFVFRPQFWRLAGF